MTPSEIKIDYFLAKINYENLKKSLDVNLEFNSDLHYYKSRIEEINQEKFKAVFGSDVDGFEPIGFIERKYPEKAILYLNFETNEVRHKIIKNSDYYMYMSLCHKSLENE